MKNGRKFAVIIIVSIEIVLGMVAGIIGAHMELELPWLGTVLPILASVYPAYMGANAWVKNKETK